MKIHIVDDTSGKIRRIKQAILPNRDNFEIEIDCSLDLSEAENKMKLNSYDILILDLNIANILEEDPMPLAGRDFIERILYVDLIKTPKRIIILTEYLNQKLDYEKEYGKSAIVVLEYNDTSQWQEELKNAINYEALKLEKNRKRSCDVAIITAVDIEERMMKKLIVDCEDWIVEGDPHRYYRGNLFSGTRKIEVVLARQSEMGIAAASTLTTKLIINVKPKYIIMVGIAAGVDKDKNFGDILFPSSVWNYSSGKHCTENGVKIYKPDSMSIAIRPELSSLFRRDFTKELLEIKSKWVSFEVEEPPKVIVGPLGCGSSVIADRSIMKMVTSHSRRTVGIDMESYGMFYSVEQTTIDKPDAICIKSISDFGDEEKNDSYQEYAAFTSSQFAKLIIENHLEFRD